MSIDLCSKCGSPVDTDFDTEFYGETGYGFDGYKGLCECCRDEFVQDDDRILVGETS